MSPFIVAGLVIVGIVILFGIVAAAASSNDKMESGATSEVLGSQVALSYCQLRGRLKQIGDTPITYGFFGGRPSRLGTVEIGYNMLGNRLRRIGASKVKYDLFGRRPKKLGTMDITYERRGRVRRIGSMTVQYDRWGKRPKKIGDLQLEYDESGLRPTQIRIGNGNTKLTPTETIVVFFFLYLRERARFIG